MADKLYYDLESPSALSTFNRMQQAARQHKIGRSPAQLRAWLEEHHPVRKRFPRNPYTVNIMDVWECDLVDVHGAQ